MLNWVRVVLVSMGCSQPDASRPLADEAVRDELSPEPMVAKAAKVKAVASVEVPPPVQLMAPGTLVPHLFAHALMETVQAETELAGTADLIETTAVVQPHHAKRSLAKRLAVVNRLNAPAGRNKGRVKIQDAVGKPMPRTQPTPVVKRGPALRGPVAPIQQSARPTMSADIICLATVRRDQHTTLVGRAA